MKKNLLLAALLMGAMGASAQIETCLADVEKAGLTAEKVAFPAGTVVGESENVTMSFAYDDSWASTDIAFQGYNGAVVNGQAVAFTTGFTGNTNPTGQALVEGASTAASAGCVVQFDVKKDGYLVVFGKMSSNKEYYVWEGLAGQGEMPVAYTFAMDWSSAALAEQPTIVYTVPADADGYFDFKSADVAKYLNGTKMFWPEKIALGADAADVKKNGVGAIIFPVYKDAGTYLVQAAGSKISTCGAVFTTEPVTALALTGTNEGGEAISLNLIGTTDGINDIKANAENVNAPAYNMAGQRVNNNFKGLMIKNGKKFINK